MNFTVKPEQLKEQTARLNDAYQQRIGGRPFTEGMGWGDFIYYQNELILATMARK